MQFRDLMSRLDSISEDTIGTMPVQMDQASLDKLRSSNPTLFQQILKTNPEMAMALQSPSTSQTSAPTTPTTPNAIVPQGATPAPATPGQQTTSGNTSSQVPAKQPTGTIGSDEQTPMQGKRPQESYDDFKKQMGKVVEALISEAEESPEERARKRKAYVDRINSNPDFINDPRFRKLKPEQKLEILNDKEITPTARAIAKIQREQDQLTDDEAKGKTVTTAQRAEILRRKNEAELAHKKALEPKKDDAPPAVVKKDDAPPAVVKKDDAPVKKAYINGAIGKGSSGPEVKKLQRDMIQFGYLNPGDDDGIFGDKTRDAVIRRQEKINKLLADQGSKTRVGVDGVWGSNSIKGFNELPDDKKKFGYDLKGKKLDAEEKQVLAIDDRKKTDAVDNNSEVASQWSEYDKNQKLAREKEQASIAQRDALLADFKKNNPNLAFDPEGMGFKDANGMPSHALSKNEKGQWVLSPATNASKTQRVEVDDPELFDVVSGRVMKKSERDALYAQRSAKTAQADAPQDSGGLQFGTDGTIDPNGFKPTHYHSSNLFPDTKLMKHGDKYYWKDSTGTVKPWVGSTKPGFFNPASVDGKLDPKTGEKIDYLGFADGIPVDNTAKPPVAKEPPKDFVRVLTPLAGGKKIETESIISLAGVVDELLNEAGTATMPVSKTDSKSVWQSTKDTVGKGVDAVGNAIPQPVKDVATKVANNPVTKFAGKAAGPALTALSVPTIPSDARQAFELSDKGDTVGAWLKGGQAALNTAALGTTAAMVAPPLTVPAGIATGVLGATSLGLAGAEAIRDKWFPYKGKETADVKSKSANEELNRVLTLTQYKVGK